MDKPDAYNLSKLEWDLFVSLSWASLNLSPGERRKYWFSWLRGLADRVGVHFGRVLWILRTEFGETTAREHYHAVIGGLPKHSLNRALTAFAAFTWEQQPPLVYRASGRVTGPWKRSSYALLSRFCGTARVRLYDPALNGLEYSLPQEGEDAGGLGLSAENGTIAGANRYEVAKFSGAESVEYSLSVVQLCNAGRRRLIGFSCKAVESVQKLSRAIPGERVGVESGNNVRRSPALAITGQSLVNCASVESSPFRGHKSAWVEESPGLYAIAS